MIKCREVGLGLSWEVEQLWLVGWLGERDAFLVGNRELEGAETGSLTWLVGLVSWISLLKARGSYKSIFRPRSLQ